MRALTIGVCIAAAAGLAMLAGMFIIMHAGGGWG
jgi:hypothetical protein